MIVGILTNLLIKDKAAPVLAPVPVFYEEEEVAEIEEFAEEIIEETAPEFEETATEIVEDAIEETVEE